MDTFIEFVATHWALSAALVGLIIAILANELYQLRDSQHALSPTAATRMYNQQDALFIDLRDENSFQKDHLPAALNVPEAYIEKHQDRLDRYQGRPAIVYGQGGSSVSAARGRIEQAGLSPAYQLQGGMNAWRETGLPTEGRT